MVLVIAKVSGGTYDSRGEGDGGNGNRSHVEFVGIATCTSAFARQCNGGPKQDTQQGLGGMSQIVVDQRAEITNADKDFSA